MIFTFLTFCFRNCIIKRGNVSVPYMAIATRTRSKVIQESTENKEFQEFLNSMVSSVNQDVTSFETSSMSSSSSSYYWSGESPDSVVPGSTSSSDYTSDVDTITSDVATTTNVDVPNHIASNNYSHSLQGSSFGTFDPLPGFTQSVNNDLKVSLNLFFHSM